MRTLLMTCLILLIAVSPVFSAVTSESFIGDWEGTLEEWDLRVVMHLSHAGGTWTATMDSPDQGGYGLPCDDVKVDGMKLYLALDAVDMEFDGTLSKDGNKIDGIFTQRGNRLPLILTRSGGTPKAPVAPAPAPVTTTTRPFSGSWAGTLDAGMKLRLVIHLVEKGGVWSGTMDSLDQGANGIPFTSVTLNGDKLHFEIKPINGVYDGTMSEDGQSIAGTWSQGVALPLNLKRGDASSMPAPARPQEPKPPLPYTAEEVIVPGPGGIPLAGTLTLPRGTAPFAGVLLISGSGPQDRDEALVGHKPFLVLADHLTRAGIAVLRVDERGVGKSMGTFAGATTDDFAQDALAAVQFLKSRTEIDPRRIGLIGHSEGGIVAPIVATRSNDVAFVVLMSGPGVPLDELLLRQSELIMKANGASDAMIKQNESAQHQLFAIVRAEKDPIVAKQKLQEAGDAIVKTMSAEDPATAEAASANMKASIEMVNTPWFRYLLAFEPAAVLRQVRVPVLALNGSLDLQVDAKQNLPAIEKALKDGGNKDVTLQELPGLNHLFQTATTGSPTEYATIEETMSPTAMKMMSDWILARTSAKKK